MTNWTTRSNGTTTWTEHASSSNVGQPVSWTTVTRPSVPFISQTGLNTDFDGLETWNGTKWNIMGGEWTTNTRPDTTDIAVGSIGFNSDDGMGLEMWNGTEWQIL